MSGGARTVSLSSPPRSSDSPVAPDRFKQRDEAGFRALALERVCRGGKPEAGRPMEGCLEIRKRDEVGTGPQEGRKEWRESRGEV